MSATSRWPAGRWVAGAAAVVATGAAGAVALSPGLRNDLHRLRSFARPLQEDDSPPIPPPLPPGRVVAVEGVGELFVRDTGGDGPVVLLLHGWTASADVNFFPVYGALSDTYRVLALDHRGHGRGLRSSKPFSLEDCADDAAALLEQLGIPRAVAVGYSMGGPISLLFARRHADRCAGLVLEATSLEFQDGLRERALWSSLNLLEAGLRHGSGGGVLQRALRVAAETDPSLDRHRAWLAAEFRRGDIGSIVAAGRALSEYDARPWASVLGLPTAVVVTTRDHLVPARKQRAMATALSARIFELPGDHDIPVTGGAAFARLTRLAVDHVTGAPPAGRPIHRHRAAVGSHR